MNDSRTSENESLADVQSSPDQRQIPITKVGIKDIRHPVRIGQRGGGEQHTVATFGMYVNLPHHFKGTHMSRFVEILSDHEYEITVASFRQMLGEVTERLDAESSHIDMSFTYFMDKRAPVTGAESLVGYDITLMGERHGSNTDISVCARVPVTSLCPCSKEISDYGAHNQRSLVSVTAQLDAFMWVEELIETVEAEGSCELYSLLKRPDEKYVTERAYERPKFVEDIVRDVALRLDADERVGRYQIEAENYESIHNHNAYAYIDRDQGAGK